MKRLIALLMCFMLVTGLSLISCQKKETAEEKKETVTEPAPAPETGEEAAPEAGGY
jgi:hypothetical protein